MWGVFTLFAKLKQFFNKIEDLECFLQKNKLKC